MQVLAGYITHTTHAKSVASGQAFHYRYCVLYSELTKQVTINISNCTTLTILLTVCSMHIVMRQKGH